MRSYDAARGYFSFLEVLSWALIVLGTIVAFVAAAAAGSNSAMLAFVAVAPGAILAATGFFCLVFIQSSRASVDSAEYAQQSLQLSRDQFEVSKQLLRLAQGKDTPATYAAPGDATELTNISFDTDASSADLETPPTDTAPDAAGIGSDTSTPAPQSYPEHISFENGRFLVEGKRFWSRADAETHVKEHVLVGDEEHS